MLYDIRPKKHKRTQQSKGMNNLQEPSHTNLHVQGQPSVKIYYGRTEVLPFSPLTNT